MRFDPTPIPGAYVVAMEPAEDERGFFARTWCAEEFAAQGLAARLEQCSISYNERRGTLRGMHYQRAPHLEAKLVRCLRGALYDVIVDARRGSSTEGRFFSVTLDERTPAMLYVPEGVAHGFLTLAHATEVAYAISGAYRPQSQAGFRWDDPQIGIPWPFAPASISPRDERLPAFAERMGP